MRTTSTSQRQRIRSAVARYTHMPEISKALASSLERCGHSVWWDRHIKGGTLAATALKGAWELFAARKGTAEKFKEAKSTAVWAGGLSLLSWFALSLMVGAGLYQWGTDNGAAALSKSFALGTTSALTILFVWGTKTLE